MSLTLNDYQEKALSTAIYPTNWAIIYPALKLAGEAGEVAEKIGKVLRDDGGSFTEAHAKMLAKEIGDVLWYCAALAHDIGYTLEEVGQMNVAKLADRQARNVLKGSGDER